MLNMAHIFFVHQPMLKKEENLQENSTWRESIIWKVVIRIWIVYLVYFQSNIMSVLSFVGLFVQLCYSCTYPIWWQNFPQEGFYPLKEIGGKRTLPGSDKKSFRPNKCCLNWIFELVYWIHTPGHFTISPISQEDILSRHPKTSLSNNPAVSDNEQTIRSLPMHQCSISGQIVKIKMGWG